MRAHARFDSSALLPARVTHIRCLCDAHTCVWMGTHVCVLLPCWNTKELSLSGSSCWKGGPGLWHISGCRKENVPLRDGGEDHRPCGGLILVYLRMLTLRWVQKPEYSGGQNYRDSWLNLAGIA